MKAEQKLPLLTLILMISFASVNAVLFTPALPDIAEFFKISIQYAQQMITWFLIAYTLGQLLYGPIANRYGRKPALYLGISIQILSSFICVFAGFTHIYFILIIGRFFLALGSGVGLKMAFTLVNECYETKIASQKTSYLMMAFAITPALGVAIGGILNAHFGWMSCFLAEAIYGFILLFLVSRLPETQSQLDYHAFELSHLLKGYTLQFKNKILITGGFLMGIGTSFIYIFAAAAPFIAIKLMHMNSIQYGTSNLLPAMGIILGSLASAQLAKKLSLQQIILIGIFISIMGMMAMMVMILLKFSAIISIFLPAMVIYIGLSLVIANASTLAMSQTQDKAHGSAVMNFVNMGMATISVLSLGLCQLSTILLPIIYFVLCVFMVLIYIFLLNKQNQTVAKLHRG